MYRKIRFRWTKHIDFIILDIVCLIAADMAGFYIRGLGLYALFTDAVYRTQLITLVLADIFVILALSTMKDVLKRGFLKGFTKTISNTVILAAIEALFFFSTKSSEKYSRLAFGYFIVIYIVLTGLVRLLYRKFLVSCIIPKRGSSLLIICPAGEIPQVDRMVESGALNTYRIAGLAITDREHIPVRASSVPIVTEGSGIRDWVRQNWVDEVLVLLPECELRDEIANILMPMGITVHISIRSIAGLEASERLVQTLGEEDVITFCWNTASSTQMLIKRLFDIIGGLVGCIFTLLLTVVVGPLIYFASPGPVFFTQKRVGRNGKIFKMYKFRSMYTDAEERKKDYMAQNRVADGMMFKLDFDPRIIGNRELPDGTRKTGLGEFIRKTSIDEFPQFFNVLKGDMSLVGTRPPTLDEWEKYKDYHRARLSMRPGITGLWQVSGRSNITDFDEIVKLDTHYIAHFSCKEDLRILLKTVLVVLKHEGSM